MSVDDCVTLIDTSAKAVLLRVVAVRNVTRIGAYSPLTENGNILVNDIHASCYSVVQQHQFVHNFMVFVYSVYHNIVSLLPTDVKNLDYTQLPYFVQLPLTFIEYILPAHSFSV